MTFVHIGIAKGVSIGIVVVATVIVAMDPTYKVALVVGATAISVALITNGTTLFVRWLDRKDRQEILFGQQKTQELVNDVKHQTDGIFAHMSAKADKAEAKSDRQDIELKAATTRADNADGRREGVEAEQERHKEGN
jgi:hypothetical protein